MVLRGAAALSSSDTKEEEQAKKKNSAEEELRLVPVYVVKSETQVVLSWRRTDSKGSQECKLRVREEMDEIRSVAKFVHFIIYVYYLCLCVVL